MLTIKRRKKIIEIAAWLIWLASVVFIAGVYGLRAWLVTLVACMAYSGWVKLLKVRD